MRDIKLIKPQNVSKPDGSRQKSDASNFMKNITHSFLSKERVLTDFLEGLQALALTSNGSKDLNMISSRAHAQMVYV